LAALVACDGVLPAARHIARLKRAARSGSFLARLVQWIAAHKISHFTFLFQLGKCETL
jgi:hypothetical protein